MGGTPQMDTIRNGGAASGPYEWENYSAFAMMLPYLEQSQIYNAMNMMICPMSGYGYAEFANATAANTKLNTFLCPSDPYSGNQNLCNYNASFGTTTYMPFYQVGSGSNASQGDTTGLFTIWKSYKLGNVTDGTSNTVAFAEALTGQGGSGYNQRPERWQRISVSRQLRLPPVWRRPDQWRRLRRQRRAQRDRPGDRRHPDLRGRVQGGCAR